MNSIEPVLAWNLGPRYPHWSELLRDQTRVAIRPITKDDAALERAFIEALSPQARRFRFLGQMSHPSQDMVRKLTDIDYDHDVAFVAIAPDAVPEKFVGISRYSTSRDGTSCECAVAVLDDWQDRGLGTALMRHLIEVARSRGICYIYSIDAAENAEMAELARYLGFNRTTDQEDETQVIHSLWLNPVSR